MSGKRTLSMLMAAALAGAPLAAMAVHESEAPRQEAAPAVSDALIRQVQQALREQGYRVDADGHWGADSRRALRRFQQLHGMEASGELTAESLAALHVVEGAPAESTAQLPVSQSLIREVQRALNDYGYQLEADGAWGEDSREALRNFQRENELGETGELDRQTLAALHVMEDGQVQARGESSEDELTRVLNEVFE